MAEIISLDAKLQHKADEKAARLKKRKQQIVRKLLTACGCDNRCARCGSRIEPSADTRPAQDLRVPYSFCDICAEEYIEFIEYLKGNRRPDHYWHNMDWIELWQRWLNYQSALDRYLKSKEFNRLITELTSSGPESDRPR